MLCCAVPTAAAMTTRASAAEKISSEGVSNDRSLGASSLSKKGYNTLPPNMLLLKPLTKVPHCDTDGTSDVSEVHLILEDACLNFNPRPEGARI